MTHLKLAALALMLAAPLSIPPASAQQGVPGGHFIENWDLDRDGAVTPLEARTKRDELFVMFDADGSGALDATEYDLFDETRKADMATNAGGRGPGPMPPVIGGLVRDFNDTDGDGLVSRDEFADRTSDWFPMMDINGDGLVTTADFGPPRG